MFVDHAEIYIKPGPGGKGCRSVYRDKYTRKGIFDGGDGGKGSDIVIRADRNLRTLFDFRYNRHFYGLKGGNGSGKNKKGKDASARVIRVPPGVIIKDAETDCVLGVLDKENEELVAGRGGKGGLGNRHHMDPTPGEVPPEKKLILDLKLIADVGLIGFPNVGKSTLISSISNARPSIAAYPFTTKFPVLGVVGVEEDSFVIADIPGLIEGASHGKGLGDKFLRHVERTKILLHLVDMSGSEGRDPLEDYHKINRELKFYSREVGKKPQIIVANKMDMKAADENFQKFKKTVKKRVLPISALKKTGLEELVGAIKKKL